MNVDTIDWNILVIERSCSDPPSTLAKYVYLSSMCLFCGYISTTASLTSVRQYLSKTVATCAKRCFALSYEVVCRCYPGSRNVTLLVIYGRPTFIMF